MTKSNKYTIKATMNEYVLDKGDVRVYGFQNLNDFKKLIPHELKKHIIFNDLPVDVTTVMFDGANYIFHVKGQPKYYSQKRHAIKQHANYTKRLQLIKTEFKTSQEL